uniref:SS18 N-terminal domain-containing protein n=1 Tax=Periophthalmus magnuspinnatus TaxID=409849 RepID=A0A3B4A3L6_9GOBI
MSVAFAPHRQRGKGDITPAGIQKLLDENNQLIQCIMDFQSKGKTAECSHVPHVCLFFLVPFSPSLWLGLPSNTTEL